MASTHFETLIRLSPVGMFRTDAGGRCIYVNERWCEINGLTATAARGDGWLKSIHPDDRERIAKEWSQAARLKGAFASEYRIQRTDGRLTWVLANASPERDDAGAIVGYVGAVTDITARRRAEDALRQAQQDHADLINSIDGIVWEADPGTFNFLFVSEQAERLLGYPLADWFDTPNAWIKHLHPDDRDHVLEYCMAETAKGLGHDFEYRMIAADGRTIWLRDIVTVRQTPAGMRVRGVMVDVTAHREAREALQRSERHFRALIENSWDAIISFAADGTIVAATEAVLRILGYSTEELVGRNAVEFARPEDRGIVRHMLDEALRHPGVGIRGEAHIRHKDGTWRCVEGVFTNLLDDPAVGAIINNFRDITERKHAEARLQESEQRFRTYAEAASDWFWETGPDHRLTFLSQRIGAPDGDHNERLGRLPWEFPSASPEDAEAWQALRELVENHQPFRDFIYRDADRAGAERFIAASGTPFFDASGRFAGYRGIGRDVTEAIHKDRALRDAKQRAETASLAKSRFLATMSHELRTPLNVIMGFADLMRSDALGTAGSPDRYRSYATDIHASAAHLLQIINDILDVARIEAGKVEIEREALTPVEIVAEIRQMMAVEIAAAGLTLAVEVADDAPPLSADRRALRQILLNLVSNAIKFTPAGGTVTVGAQAEADGAARLWVADTGIGIAAEDIDRLGQPFVQLDTAYLDKRQGVGLGLMLVRSLTALHGGTLAIESAPGRGTTVTVRLPGAASGDGSRARLAS